MSKKTPTLRRHRRSGHGYAWLDGRQVRFGPYEDPETHRRFARTLAEWIANGRRLPPEQTREEMRVADIVAAYLEYAAARISDSTAFMYLGELIEHADTPTFFMNPAKELTQQ